MGRHLHSFRRVLFCMQCNQHSQCHHSPVLATAYSLEATSFNFEEGRVGDFLHNRGFVRSLEDAL